MLNIVLFGPPGAGKGTQSQRLIEKYHLIHLSTGDLLRAEIASGTMLGSEAKKLMDQGILVPDEVVIRMISNKLEANKHAAGFIFDGYPRTVAQAQALDDLLQENNESISGMIELKVDAIELEHRLLLRGRESARPDDANPEVIKRRIEEYMSKTMPVAAYYKNQNKFFSVNGTGSIEEIFDNLRKTVSSFT